MAAQLPQLPVRCLLKGLWVFYECLVEGQRLTWVATICRAMLV